MSNQSTASSILKSFTPRVKWAADAIKKVKSFSDSVQDNANSTTIRVAKDLAGFSARPAKDFINNVQGKPIPKMSASEQRGMNMIGQGISSGLAKAALTKWGSSLANASNARDIAVKYAQVEAKGGWTVPGMKAAFDQAMQSGNAKVVRELLPKIPKEYAGTFARAIDLALKGVKPYTVLKPGLPNLGSKSETKPFDVERWANTKKDSIPNKVPKNAV